MKVYFQEGEGGQWAPEHQDKRREKEKEIVLQSYYKGNIYYLEEIGCCC